MANQAHRTFSIAIPESRVPYPWTVQATPHSKVAQTIEILAQKVAERVEEKILDKLEHLVPPMQPMLLSVKEAAIYLGRSEQAIQHLIFSHELPVVRVGRRVHLDRRDLDLWIEKNKY